MPEPTQPLNPELAARLARLGVTVGAEHLASPPVRPPGRRGGPPTDSPDDPTSPASSSSRLSTSSGAPSPAVMPIEVALPGRSVQNAHGACYLTTSYHTHDHVHGGEPLANALEACTQSLAALLGDRRVADIDLSRAAFLDTETTGLGGAGTYAFLIGVGRFVRTGIATPELESPASEATVWTYELRQYLMRHPAEERAQLAEVADWVSDCAGLVTFNGRSFDMPLLGTRYSLNRMPPILTAVPHLDLLPAARRLWRGRLPSCALVSLERNILGLEREDDVPGWLIPERYWRYRQDGDARPLVGIVHHNALDILSMVSLATRIARAYKAPEEAIVDGRDWFALARAYAAAGDFTRAIDACEGALVRGLAPVETEAAFQQLSMLHKRNGDWDQAVAIWLDLATGTSSRRLYPFEELAKYYEHRASERDLAQAMAYVERAKTLVADGTLHPRRGRRAALHDLDHRLGRLQKKLAREQVD